MADTRLTGLTELTAPAVDDVAYIVDVSNTTDNAAGSSRKITLSNLFSAKLSDRNHLINGSGTFFQRQTPGTLTARTDGQYAGDRWYVLTQTAGVQSFRDTGDTRSLHSHGLIQNQASAQRFGLASVLENKDCFHLRGRAVRFQGKVYISASSQNIRFAIVEWTGTADTVTKDIVNSWTNSTYTAGNFFTSTTTTVVAVGSLSSVAAVTWTDFSLTGTVSSSCNNLIVFVWTEGTQAQNVELYLTEMGLFDGIQPRVWVAENYADELHRCQRYYQKNLPPDTVAVDGADVNSVWYSGVGRTANQGRVTIPFPVTMRVIPTLTPFRSDDGGAAGLWSYYVGTTLTDTTATSLGGSEIAVEATMTKTASWTANSAYSISGVYTADAEL